MKYIFRFIVFIFYILIILISWITGPIVNLFIFLWDFKKERMCPWVDVFSLSIDKSDRRGNIIPEYKTPFHYLLNIKIDEKN